MQSNLETQAISRCKNGDLNAFTDLYDAYAERIYRYLYYRTHHRETAEDLVSQTFVKALDKIDTFDSSRGSFSAWIYRVARNSLIDHYRASQPTADISDAWDLASNNSVERDVGARELLEKVRKYLASLSAEARDVVIMRVWDGMSYAEIAEVTGKSEAAAKMIFSRTIARVRSTVSPSALLALLAINLVAIINQ